ncbi:MAG: ABC transporter permease [Bryobacterales bacterium]|nr:ABC transporter permease [Bryobacterales bacterium]
MRIEPKENIQLAMQALRSNGFRSALTILGIVIGITTVVTVSSLLTGLRKGVVTFFEEFGPNNIFIARFTGDPSQPKQKELRRRPINPSYATIIERLAPSVEQVGLQLFAPPVLGRTPVTARVPGFETDRVQVSGQSANMFEISPRNLKEGRVYTAEEGRRGAKVTIMGPSLAEVLYPDGKVLGKTVTVAGAEYTVIGIFEPAKGGFFGENELDYTMVVPVETVRLRYPQLDNYLLTAKARPGLRDQAYDEVQSILRRLRQVPPGQPDDFALSTADQIIKNVDKLTSVILIVSISLSGLGLLVGGIGVMNIMLVSVTERTREIGVRKAIGARRGDIIFQFLTEAVTLTGAGGLLGIVFAVLITLIIGALIPALPSEVPVWAVVAGFLMSVGVGVFFGVWPAVKAARLDPVEALRYE